MLRRLAVRSSYPSVIIADLPTCYWRLGESSGTAAVDAMAQRNGVYTNTPTLGVAGALPRDPDTAVTFASASSQYVSISDLPALRPGLGDWSMEVWVKRNGNPSASEFVLAKGDATATGYEVFISATGKVTSRLGAISGVSVTSVCDNLWHHIVVSNTRSGNQVIYIDGIADKTTDISSESARNLNNSGNALELARRSSGNYWNGSVDEVAIYIGQALTAAQAQQHFLAA